MEFRSFVLSLANVFDALSPGGIDFVQHCGIQPRLALAAPLGEPCVELGKAPEFLGFRERLEGHDREIVLFGFFSGKRGDAASRSIEAPGRDNEEVIDMWIRRLTLALFATCVVSQGAMTQVAPGDALPFPPMGKYKHRDKIRAQYDRMTDSSRMWVSVLVSNPPKLLSLSTTTVAFKLDAFALYPGEQMQAPPGVVLLRFRFDDYKSTFHGDHDAESVGELMFLLDDETRLRFPAQRIDWDLHFASRDLAVTNVRDVIASAMPIREFLQLVNAEKVEGRLRGATFTMDNRNLEALRDFASRLNPLAPITP